MDGKWVVVGVCTAVVACVVYVLVTPSKKGWDRETADGVRLRVDKVLYEIL
jgi:hypothetical protein